MGRLDRSAKDRRRRYGWLRFLNLDPDEVTLAQCAADGRAIRPSFALSGPVRRRRIAMHRIAKANIDKFTSLLETETDPAKRETVARLLAEEEEKLKQMAQRHEKKQS